MKPIVKIALLLTVLTSAVCLWHWSQSRQHQTLAAALPAAPTHATRPPPPAAPLPRAIPHLPDTAPDRIPASVYGIVGAAFSSSFAERVAQTRALHSNLTLPEVQALYRYLLVSSSAAAQDREQENWLRNELMDKLTSQAMPPPELVQVLVAIYQDPAQDIVMRDYAVQHMRPAYVQAGPEQRDLLQQALWNAATETDSSVAGTALLALQSLGHEYKEIDADRLGAVSLNLAGEGRCGELSRITAVQVCGRLGLKQAAPLLTQLAQDADSIPLRIASIAALGDVGDEAARTWLQQLAGQADPRLRPALQTALNKLNRRQGT